MPCFGLAWINARCPPKPFYHCPSSAEQGRENMMKGSTTKIRTGRDHSPITATDKTDWTWGEKKSLIYKTSSPHPSLLPGLKFTPVSLPPPPEWHMRTGNGGYCQFITCCLCHSFLLRAKTPHTLPLLQCEVSVTGDSSLQTSPTWVLPTGCSSSQTAPARVSSTGCSPSGTGCSSVGPPRGSNPYQQTCSGVGSSLHGSAGPGRSLL